MSKIQDPLGQTMSAKVDRQDKIQTELLTLFQSEGNSPASRGLDPTQRAKALFEKIQALESSQIPSSTNSVIEQQLQQFFELALIDMVNLRLTEIEIGCDRENQEEEAFKQERKVLVELVKMLFQADKVTFLPLLNNLQESLLQDCGILGSQLTNEKIAKKIGQSVDQAKPQANANAVVRVPGHDWFQNQYVKRQQTKILYEQEKFNLQREENEGYAKLVVQLNQPNLSDLSKDGIAQLINNVNQLTGYFNLDPNRILDLILEAFENNISELISNHGGRDLAYYLNDLDKVVEVYIKLIDSTSLSLNQPNNGNNSRKIAALLGFKIQNTLQEQKLDQNDHVANPKDVIPYPLLVLTALLIKNDVILPENIWPYLVKQSKEVSVNPQTGRQEVKFPNESPDLIEVYHQELTKLLNKRYQALDRTVLDQEEKDRENQRYKAERDKLTQMKGDSFPYNYQLWLVACLIAVNDFEDAELVIGSMWGDEQLDLTIHNELLCSIFTYTELIIEQMYAPISSKRAKASQNVAIAGGSKGVKACHTAQDLATNLPKILRILGVHLGLNQSIFNRVLRTVNHYMVDRSSSEEIKREAFRMTGRYFLPALCATKEYNSKLDNEVWQIMKKIEFKERFRFYQTLLCSGYLTSTTLLTKLVTLYPKAIKWTKSLSDDEDQIKKMSKEVSDIANGGNGLILATQLLKVCANYNNLTKPLILTMERGKFEDLTLDMISFCMLKTLVDKQEEFKKVDSEGNVPLSLTYLTGFGALFFKAFYQVDLRPILNYTLNRLKVGDNFHETIFLSGIVQSMFGQKDLQVNLLNDEQLQSLAGGMQLKLEAFRYAQQYQSTERCRHALMQFFYQKEDQKVNVKGELTAIQLTIPFRIMAHLAQQTQHILNDNEAPDLIYIQNIFDKIHSIFCQFVDAAFYLGNDHQQYKLLMPDLKYMAVTLSREYRLPCQYSFHIIRRSFKQIYKMSKEEFEELVSIYKSIFDYEFQNKIDLYDEEKPSNDAIEEKGEEDFEWDDYPYWDEVKFLKSQQEKGLWNHFKEEIFGIFWQLELSDVTSPSEIYDEQIKQKDLDIQNVQSGLDLSCLNQGANAPSGAATAAEPSKHSSSSRKDQIRREIERLKEAQRKLKNEQKQSQVVNEQVRTFLKNNLRQYFEQIKDENGISQFLTQYCLYPRLMFSPADALYSIEFLKILVETQVPRINVLNILQQIMKGIFSAIHCCSNNESENLGLFFMEWFKMIEKWTKNSGEVWKRDYSNYSGFAQKFGQPDKIVTFEHLEKIVESIHRILAGRLKECFQNPKKQFMKTRCALKILQRIRPVFPRDKKIAESIQEELQKIISLAKDEIQQDIRTLAFGYSKNLKELIAGKIMAPAAAAGAPSGNPSSAATAAKPQVSRDSNAPAISNRRVSGGAELVGPGKASANRPQFDEGKRQVENANPATRSVRKDSNYNQLAPTQANPNKREEKQAHKEQSNRNFKEEINRDLKQNSQGYSVEHQSRADPGKNRKASVPNGDDSNSSRQNHHNSPAGGHSSQVRRKSKSRSPYNTQRTQKTDRPPGRDSKSTSPYRHEHNYQQQASTAQRGSQPRSGSDRNNDHYYEQRGGNQRPKKEINEHNQNYRGDNRGDAKEAKDGRDGGRGSTRIGTRPNSGERMGPLRTVDQYPGRNPQSSRQDNHGNSGHQQSATGGRQGGGPSHQHQQPQALLGKSSRGHADVAGGHHAGQGEYHMSQGGQYPHKSQKRKFDGGDHGSQGMPHYQGGHGGWGAGGYPAGNQGGGGGSAYRPAGNSNKNNQDKRRGAEM